MAEPKDKDNKLTTQEKRVIYLQKAGKEKYQAWMEVYRPDLDPDDIDKKERASLQAMASRFFKQIRNRTDYNMFMENLETAKPIKDYTPLEQLEQRLQVKGVNEVEEIQKFEAKRQIEKEIARTAEEQRVAWIKTFTDIENPSSTTPYGIGLFLGAKVIQTINEREKYIKAHPEIKPIDRDYCCYTATDVSAIKAVLSALLPFTPAPTPIEERAMTMASVILGLTAENIGIDPDDYVAPTPPGVRPHEEEVIDTELGTND